MASELEPGKNLAYTFNRRTALELTQIRNTGRALSMLSPRLSLATTFALTVSHCSYHFPLYLLKNFLRFAEQLRRLHMPCQTPLQALAANSAPTTDTPAT